MLSCWGLLLLLLLQAGEATDKAVPKAGIREQWLKQGLEQGLSMAAEQVSMLVAQPPTRCPTLLAPLLPPLPSLRAGHSLHLCRVCPAERAAGAASSVR